MFCSKLLKTLGSAACLLTASSGFADALANESFENYDTNNVTVADITTLVETGKKMWSGYGYIDAGVATNEQSFAGYPISGSHTNVLTVEGYVICSNKMESANGSAQVDMMVKVAKPDEALSADGLSDAQIAVAVDTNGTLAVYCLPRAGTGTAAWRTVSTTTYTEGTWLRVGLVFDYGNGFCQLRVNGQTVTSANGAYKTDTTSQNGSWFRLANASTKITEVKVVGSTAIDDVVVTHSALSDYNPTYSEDPGTQTARTIGDTVIASDWFRAQGVAADANATAPDGSGMKVGEKYITGQNVDDGQVFELKDMTFVKDDKGITKVQLKFPGVDSTYRIWGCDTEKGNYTELDAGVAVAGTGFTTYTITLPSVSTVKYFKVKASK